MSRVWKITAGVAIVAAVLLGGFIYSTIWEGSTKEIETVANQFQAEPGWKQVTNQVVPPRMMCLEANCPSVHRVWETDSALTKEGLQKVLYKSGWRFDIKKDCEIGMGASGVMPVCSGEGVADNYRISVTVWGNSEDIKEKIILNIKEK